VMTPDAALALLLDEGGAAILDAHDRTEDA
jgi:hypothetical protein